MNHWKKYLSLLLALGLSLSLSACGGESAGSRERPISIPDQVENLVIDDSVECDYSGFLGTWASENGRKLVIEVENRTRYELDDAEDNLLASGDLQYVEKYGYVYAYNEHDGMAHRCWFDENNTMHIDTYGDFRKVMDEASDETENEEVICTPLAGSWYLDGKTAAGSLIEIDVTGTIWSLYEKGPDGKWTEVDYGTVKSKGGNQYEAVSDSFEDVAYDMFLTHDHTLIWGDDIDCYIRK